MIGRWVDAFRHPALCGAQVLEIISTTEAGCEDPKSGQC
jgi:hypothetical protein